MREREKKKEIKGKRVRYKQLERKIEREKYFRVIKKRKRAIRIEMECERERDRDGM